MGKAEKQKGDAAFTFSHASTYGLKVMNRCADTTEVLSVRCQFCVYFGVEIDPTKPQRERAPKTTNMAWTRPFRVDKYTSHHKSQHPSQWAIYQACSVREKLEYFASITPFANMILAHVNSGSVTTPIELKIQSLIFDVLIGELFFHPDDQGGTTQKNALKLFKHVEGGISDGPGDHCEVVISNREQFSLVVRNLSRGMSFRQCVNNHDDVKAVTGTIFKT